MVQNLAISIPSYTFNPGSMDSPSSPGSPGSPASDISETLLSFSEIPLTALSTNTRHQISHLLKSRKILRSEEGYERDWRGIAFLAKQRSLCDENAISGDDPMAKVLQLWCSNNPKTATFAYLERFLGMIDRWDVSDDINENLIKDAKDYQTQMQKKSLSLTNDITDAASLPETKVDYANGSNPNILTIEDVLCAQRGLPPQLYDAFLLYAEADVKYAAEIVAELEDKRDFKLCLNRNLLPGLSFTHVALTQLIEERCKHLIVILTEEFFKSPENIFLVNYTTAFQIVQKTNKIKPLIYEDTVVMPRTLKIFTNLRYSSVNDGFVNFWDKLALSISNISIDIPKINPPVILPTPPADMPTISINGHPLVEDNIPKKKERLKFKKHSSLRHSFNKLLNSDDSEVTLRNAHSTLQLSAGYIDRHDSLSNLSTTSCETKKKKRWPSKLIKKVFTRSSTKLQETA